MKVLTVIGARPQFVKAAVVSKALMEKPGMSEFLVHTGQHYDDNMSKVFFDEMGISLPDANLGISGGGHGAMTGQMLVKIEELLVDQSPDCVLVYGDTNSTLAGALAASKLNVPCAHVEAGLRSDNRAMPEEINRILTDHACDLLFAPTEEAVKRLKREGIAAEKVVRTGDVMLDAALLFGETARSQSTILERLSLRKKGFALCTLHRAENVDSRDALEWLIAGLGQVAESLPVILPIHPRTLARLKGFELMDQLSSAIKIVDPVGYLDILKLQSSASLILTDSGGMQKEAFFQKVPCVTLRSETEWIELLPGGHNRLARPMIESISEKAEEALSSDPDWSVDLYGDGHSSETIVQAIIDHR
ncbi:MAG: UDP-N-acetylglucosamine 2-epimerase (non-hydrolyzing) [Verrucomicrobia bacterium]|nr:UDP-N-acetylglucosamine 2-epimerase (non-hydrolyzing) [Verrucomicrobiota bacterium]